MAFACSLSAISKPKALSWKTPTPKDPMPRFGPQPWLISYSSHWWVRSTFSGSANRAPRAAKRSHGLLAVSGFRAEGYALAAVLFLAATQHCVLRTEADWGEQHSLFHLLGLHVLAAQEIHGRLLAWVPCLCFSDVLGLHVRTSA